MRRAAQFWARILWKEDVHIVGYISCPVSIIIVRYPTCTFTYAQYLSWACVCVCLNPCWCLHYMSAFVNLLITFSISMYIMCVMFIPRFRGRPQGRRFTNFHYYYTAAMLQQADNKIFVFCCCCRLSLCSEGGEIKGQHTHLRTSQKEIVWKDQENAVVFVSSFVLRACFSQNIGIKSPEWEQSSTAVLIESLLTTGFSSFLMITRSFRLLIFFGPFS